MIFLKKSRLIQKTTKMSSMPPACAAFANHWKAGYHTVVHIITKKSLKRHIRDWMQGGGPLKIKSGDGYLDGQALEAWINGFNTGLSDSIDASSEAYRWALRESVGEEKPRSLDPDEIVGMLQANLAEGSQRSTTNSG